MSKPSEHLNTGPKPGESLTLAEVGRRLGGRKGRDYWRSLDELHGSPEFAAAVENEFPNAMTTLDPVNRREFIRLMGASMAMAGLAACTRQSSERIIPYVDAPEEIVPGKPLFYATAMTLGGYAYGLLAESHMGRPTKVEGNPEHPASLGATHAMAQASVLTLYDPDRSQDVLYRGRVSTWAAFTANLKVLMETQGDGAGLSILTETVTSPTLAAQIRALQEKYPKASWHQYEPLNRDAQHEASVLAYGKRVDTHYRMDQADVILSLDSDFLAHGPGHLRYAADFSARRDVNAAQGMNRLYSVQSTPTVTSATADHGLRLRASEVEGFARAVAKELGVKTDAAQTTAPAEWVQAVAKDLRAHKGACVVVPGEQQPAAVHALAHAMNEALGNHGKTVVLTEPVEAEPVNQTASIQELVTKMRAGSVNLLVMLGGNPAYDAPADLNFAEAMESVPTRVRLGLYVDETSTLSHWHLPDTHYLEAWSDARAYDGTTSIVQPLILPLYGGQSAHQVLAALAGSPDASGYDLVRAQWEQTLGDEFEATWRKAVHDGIVPNTAAKEISPAFKGDLPKPSPAAGELEVVFKADAATWDGRFANNGWLQELPRPHTKMVWDNAILVSAATARQLRVESGDVIVVGSGDRTIQGPVWITPGQSDDCLTVALGYGRKSSGRVGTGVGFDAYLLRTSSTPSIAPAFVHRVGTKHELVTTQAHHTLAGRDIVRSGTLEQYQDDHHFAHHGSHGEQESIYPGFDYSKGPQWGMVIDLSRCTGCNACVTACQAENNIPIVGKTEVGRGREMQWIRIDRYYVGDENDPETAFQPMACVHCENAPCEAVCPVAATVHSREGLNQMVYNRCVGTRYCSNNCPYKVRRFNFFKYSDLETPSLKPLRNPDVTVRVRGVMEKCTYCVQRISAARITAKKDQRPIADGEVVTACQQVCPAQAITFGDIRDEKSKVAQLRKSPLNYSVLKELNTVPRTTYLARVRNPNPELEGEHAGHGHA